MPENGAFTNQIQTEWVCYNCFVSIVREPVLLHGGRS